MSNAYYDFNNKSDFTLFINAGLVYVSSKMEGLFFKEEDEHTKAKRRFTFSIGAGIAYKIYDSVYTSLSYKMIKIKSESKNKDQEKINANEYMSVVKIKAPSIYNSFNFGIRAEF